MDSFIDDWMGRLLSDGEVAVATVVGGLGSRPREDGAQMLIARSGQITDTIGGGRLEADVMVRARQVLERRTTELYSFALTGRDAALSDMICGGRGDVLIYYSGVRDMPVLRHIGELPIRDGWLVFPVDRGGGLAYIGRDGSVAGGGEAASFAETLRERDIRLTEREGKRFVVLWIATPGVLHIMGAGHVSRQIAAVAGIAGIGCAVYDDRPEFANKERFPGARCVPVEDMSRPPRAEVGEKDMIAIVTRGHVYDMDCLEWALATPAGYIGMMGSQRKSAMILEELRKKGFPAERLAGVHTPIGLNIGAQTPAEIAVSVVAELIAYKKGFL